MRINMRKQSGPLVVIFCGCIAGCSGSGSGANAVSSGGKSSTLPLVLNLQASPSPAWLNAEVTFSVTCQSVVGNTNLNYLWTFGDGTTETTTVATETHAFTTGGSYTYAVTCTDGNESSEITSPQQLKVYAYDLNEVASGTCSTGLRGLGWCW
jgi:PKD repeat protein